MRPPGTRIKRGLAWVASTATADFDAVREERGTGHFVGTSVKEVALALEWLERLLRDAT